VHAVGDHARAVSERRRRSGAGDPDRKEQPDTVRTPEVEIFANDGFKEESALHRPIEDLRQTDFELIDRQAVVVAGATVRRREWPGS
jgi:hypothetical protein